MNIFIKFLLIIQLLAISAFAHNPPEFILQLRWLHQFQSAGYYAAIEKGFYKEQGLNIVIKEGTADIDPLNEVLLQRADFGVANSSLVIDYLNGANVAMLGVIFQHSPNILLTLGDIKTPSDLINNGDVSLMSAEQDIDLKAIFLKDGIDLNKINFVADNDHLKSLIEHKVAALNAYTSNEPYELKQKNIPYNIIDPRDYGLDFYGDLFFTSQMMLKEHPDEVRKFYIATIKGWEYALEHSDEIIDIILKKYNTQNKSKAHLEYEAQELKKLANQDFVQIGYSNPGRWEHIVNTFRMFDVIKSTRSLDGFIYNPHIKTIDKKIYYYLFVSIVIIVLVSVLSFFIYRNNKILKKILAKEKAIFKNGASAGVIWDKNHKIIGWNLQAQKMFGWSEDEALGKSIIELLVPSDEREKVKDIPSKTLKNSDKIVYINKNLTKSGEIIICEWHNTKLPTFEDEDIEVVSLAIDITQKILQEELLKEKIKHDSLTGLYNKEYFYEVLDKTYALSNRYDYKFGIAYIDLDGFKQINDTFGHSAGDFVLKTISDRFSSIIRKEDTLARMGGDEFALLFYVTSHNEPCEILVNRILLETSKPIEYDGNHLSVSASIGVSFYTKNSNITIQELIHMADVAMYDAKKAGKNRYHISENK